MTEQILQAESRKGPGKEANRKLRNQGIIPAIFYHKGESLPMQISELELIRMLKSGDQVIALKMDGKKKKALIKEIQYHPVTERIIHVDFQEVSMSEVIEVLVPLNFAGTPAGLKEGGLFDVNMHQIEVKCKASDIPHQLDVDVSKLEIGDTIHIEDLDFGDLEIITSPDILVAGVTVAKDLVEEIEAEQEAELEAEEAEEAEEGEEGEETGEGEEAGEDEEESKEESGK
ncbi:MAG: 50S ribosomal protein L25 [Candidatus Marinimicrobia bacterium]|nr:50S ribosomal protein L25 [Candidatus Neomarinimicrobiota bacterium]